MEGGRSGVGFREDGAASHREMGRRTEWGVGRNKGKIRREAEGGK